MPGCRDGEEGSPFLTAGPWPETIRVSGSALDFTLCGMLRRRVDLSHCDLCDAAHPLNGQWIPVNLQSCVASP